MAGHVFQPGSFGREKAAEYLDISPRKLDDLQARGLVVPVSLDGMKRFRRVDLDEYLDGLSHWETANAKGA
jgi:DNA-binding transcriptional MerR regulator